MRARPARAARVARAARAWLDVAREHPRHIVLFSLAAGLALGPISSLATVAAAGAAAAVGGRRALATLAAGAVLLGAVVADARLAALDTGALRALEGQRWEGAATILEPVRERGRHAVARVQLAGLDETAVARLRVPEAAWSARRRGGGAAGAPGYGRRYADGRRSRAPLGAARHAGRRSAPSWPCPGGSRRSGSTTPISVAAARRRRWRSTGGGRRARGAVAFPARWTPCGGGPRPGSVVGSRRPRRRCSPGWCSARTSGSPTTVRTDFERSGLAHLLAVSGQNVVLLAMLVLGAGMALGLPLRARLGAALVLVALYVPLAGGGPSIQRAGVMGAAGLVAALAGPAGARAGTRSGSPRW